MQSAKRYTNTFTKRIDHEGGAKRGMAKLPSPSVCGTCHAVFDKGRWTAARYVAPEMKFREWSHAETVKCPACRQKDAGIAGGYVQLSGAFLSEHRDEIERLVENEVQRAQETNPLSIILAKKELEGTFTLETSTEHLAERIGHALKNAYAGALDLDFSHENKVVRVAWHRD